MKVMFESRGDFDNMSKWLNGVANVNVSPVLSQIATEGSRKLASATPKATGQTASGWSAEVSAKGSISEIAWVNTAHANTNVNLAILIDQGHGTGTGGYVPPKPYIKSAMDSVWKSAGDKIAKELVK